MKRIHGARAVSRLAWCTICLLAGLAIGPAHAAVPDYALLDGVLLENVRKGYVDYDGIAANPAFGQFVDQLARPAEAFGSREAELAYYINAYNAFAISGILKGYSPGSWFGRYRYFKSLEFSLGGRDINLDKLEHKLIRPMGDERIHFAIVCASLSCPRLSNRAYLPETLDEQLDAAARDFVNDVSRNRLDISQKTAFVSEIFDWFKDDFTRAAGSVPAYLARYAQDPAARAALLEGRLELSYLPYDWSLNGRLQGDTGDD